LLLAVCWRASSQWALPAIIDGSGRKARDRIEHFLRAAIDNDNTRRACVL
jgi:hypothetical protein